MDSWNMFDHDSVQWTEATLDEVKGELFDARKTPIQKSVEKAVEMQEERDRYDEAPDPYSQWVENTQYMTKEELADRYARFGMALAEIHEMALDSFSGKDLPEPKYMLGLCLGLAGGALNYEKPKQ
jgi:hypothetical protein